MGFKSKYALREHQVSHQEKTLKCEIPKCECMFVNKATMWRHIKKVHGKRELKFPCEHCTRVFDANAKLKTHIDIVHLGKKPYKCDLCDYDAAYSQTLREHKDTVHFGVMFTCSYPNCNKQMNRRCNLNKHMKTAHQMPLPSEIKAPKKRIVVDSWQMTPPPRKKVKKEDAK